MMKFSHKDFIRLFYSSSMRDFDLIDPSYMLDNGRVKVNCVYKGNNMKLSYDEGSLIIAIDKRGEALLGEILPIFYDVMGRNKPDFKYDFVRCDKHAYGPVVALEWSSEKEKRYNELLEACKHDYPNVSPGARVKNLSLFEGEIKPFIFGEYSGSIDYPKIPIANSKSGNQMELFKQIYKELLELNLDKDTLTAGERLQRLYAIHFLIEQTRPFRTGVSLPSENGVRYDEQFFKWFERNKEKLLNNDPDFALDVLDPEKCYRKELF